MANQELEFDLHKLAERDRFISESFHFKTPQAQDHNGVIRRVFHLRGGQLLGVREPSGGVIVFESNDVVHDFDEQGNIIRRFILNSPPEGFTILSDDERKKVCDDEHRLLGSIQL